MNKTRRDNVTYSAVSATARDAKVTVDLFLREIRELGRGQVGCEEELKTPAKNKRKAIGPSLKVNMHCSAENVWNCRSVDNVVRELPDEVEPKKKRGRAGCA